MFKKFTILFFLLAAVIAPVTAQQKKALRHYEQGNYLQALPYLVKVAENNADTIWQQRLAQTYLQLGRFAEAEKIAAPLSKGRNQDLREIYVRALLAGGKTDAAGEALAYFASINPDHPRLPLLKENYTVINELQNKSSGFSIIKADAINTTAEDFAPFFFNDQLIFLSSRPNFNIAEGELRPLISPFSIDIIDGDTLIATGKPARWMKQLHNGDHTGPIATDSLEQTIVFSRIRDDKQGWGKPGLFYITRNGNNWDKPIAFNFMEGNYSYSHPALSADGKTLYFISDKPGGQGGTDIYATQLINGSWTQPQNLGREVNTAADESFPTIDRNGTLYFGSNGHPGIGGIDIFKTIKVDEQTWQKPDNLGIPINSPHDDFSIVFSGRKNAGFFTSNRPGGTGADDIYGFTYKPNFFTGRILLSASQNDPAVEIPIVLKDQHGKKISQTTTDKYGNFIFQNLDDQEVYLLTSEESNPALSTQMLFMADEQGNLVRKTNTDSQGNFRFHGLSVRETYLGTIQDQSWISISGTLTVPDENNLPLSDHTVNLFGDEQPLAEGKTSREGDFHFEQLERGPVYSLTVDERNLKPGMIIKIADDFGREIAIIKIGDKSHRFEILPAEESHLALLDASNTSLNVDLKGRLVNDSREAISNMPVNVYNSNGVIVATGATDENGNFRFEKLPAGQDYLVMIDEQNTALADVQNILMLNEKGEIVKTAKNNQHGIFKFMLLSEDYQAMTMMSVEDTQIKLDYQGALLGGDPPAPLANINIILKDSTGTTVASTRTDARGRFVFHAMEPDHNFLMAIDDADIKLKKNAPLYLANYNGKIVKEINRAGQYASFRILPYEKKMLATISVPDTRLNLSTLALATDAFTIHFNTNSWQLSKASKAKLDRLITQLTQVEKPKMEISGFTDVRGDEELNLRLSRKRAEEVARYLATRGVKYDGITVRYYGETKLVNQCHENTPCDDAGHAPNRRAEIRLQ